MKTFTRRPTKPEKFENGVSLSKHVKCFPSTLRWRSLKTQRSPAILDLCLRKTGTEKSRDNRDVIVLKKLRFSVFRLYENAKLQIPSLSRVILKSSVFGGRLSPDKMWTEGLTVQVTLHFQISFGVVSMAPSSFYRTRNFVATLKRI